MDPNPQNAYVFEIGNFIMVEHNGMLQPAIVCDISGNNLLVQFINDNVIYSVMNVNKYYGTNIELLAQGPSFKPATESEARFQYKRTHIDSLPWRESLDALLIAERKIDTIFVMRCIQILRQVMRANGLEPPPHPDFNDLIYIDPSPHHRPNPNPNPNPHQETVIPYNKPDTPILPIFRRIYNQIYTLYQILSYFRREFHSLGISFPISLEDKVPKYDGGKKRQKSKISNYKKNKRSNQKK